MLPHRCDQPTSYRKELFPFNSLLSCSTVSPLRSKPRYSGDQRPLTLKDPAKTDRPRSFIGPYRLIEKIGEGGMGVVYRGVRQITGDLVAVKMVRTLSPKLLCALRDEVVALKKIDHPGVIQLLDEGLSDGVPWYAMELLEGVTLARFNRDLWGTDGLEPVRTRTTESRTGLEKQQLDEPGPQGGQPSVTARPLSPDVLRDIFDLYRKICAALVHVHQRGMVHRDLKPSNVFLKVGLGPVLMDFGLASRASGAIGRETLMSSMSTARAGSAHYMSPEQIRGDVVDARADLYALGCMLYETLCGHPPFDQPSSPNVLAAHLDHAPAPLSRVVGDVPPMLDSLLARLLAKSPQDRLGYAEDVDAVLAELGGQLPSAYSSAVGSEVPYLYRPRLTGRSDVLAQIDGYLENAAKGRGALLLIGGESGIGKTFLASEVGRIANGRRFTTLTGDCLPVAGHEVSLEVPARAALAPFQPFRRLLQYVADRCREGGPIFTAHLLGARGKILAPYEPSLAFAPGQDQLPEPPVMVAAAARHRVFRALFETISALSEEQPLLWVLDDLQWADELSLSFLSSQLAQLVADRRILVVATFRSDEVTSELTTLIESPMTTVINLGHLSASTIDALVAEMLGMTSIPRDLATVLAEHAEGNPFFVAEYLRAAVSEAVLCRRNGRWEFDRPRVLSAARVIGREVDLLAHVLATPPFSSTGLVDGLELVCGWEILEWLDTIWSAERSVLYSRLARPFERFAERFGERLGRPRRAADDFLQRMTLERCFRDLLLERRLGLGSILLRRPLPLCQSLPRRVPHHPPPNAGPLRVIVPLSLLGPRDAIAVQLGHQGATRNTEEVRSAGLAPGAGLERVEDGSPLRHLFRIVERGEAFRGTAGGRRGPRRPVDAHVFPGSRAHLLER